MLVINFPFQDIRLWEKTWKAFSGKTHLLVAGGLGVSREEMVYWPPFLDKISIQVEVRIKLDFGSDCLLLIRSMTRAPSALSLLIFGTRQGVRRCPRKSWYGSTLITTLNLAVDKSNISTIERYLFTFRKTTSNCDHHFIQIQWEKLKS